MPCAAKWLFAARRRLCHLVKQRASYCCLCAVRTAKFVARKQWVITGADDMYIRVYNHNTMEKIKSFEAHTDYIRHAATHLPPADCTAQN